MIKIILLLSILVLIALAMVVFRGDKSSTLTLASPTPLPTELPEDLLRKCGDVWRDDFEVDYNDFTQITGPAWNFDCSYAAMGVWQSGIGFASYDPSEAETIKKFAREEQARRKAIEGIYLFDPKIKESERIYIPKSDGESPQFLKWEGNEAIIFKAGQKDFKLNINTREVTEIPSF